MKKGKIVALLSLSVLTLGVVAGGIASEGGLLTEFDAGLTPNTQTDNRCQIYFDHSDMSEDETYLQSGTVRLSTDGSTVMDNLIYLFGSIYTDGTAYGLHEGTQYGSVTNGIKRIVVETAQLGEELVLYTAHTLLADGTPNWNEQPNAKYVADSTQEGHGTFTFDFDMAMSFRPNYFKLTSGSSNSIAIKNIYVDCTKSGEPDINNAKLIAEGTYVATNNINIADTTKTYQTTIKVNSDKSMTIDTYQKGGSFKPITVFAAGSDGYDNIIFHQDKDSVGKLAYSLKTDNSDYKHPKYTLCLLNATEFESTIYNVETPLECTKLDLAIDTTAINSGDTFKAESGVEYTIVATRNAGSNQWVKWSADNNLNLTISGTANDKCKFIVENVETPYQITASCGSVNITFTVQGYVPASNTIPFPSELAGKYNMLNTDTSLAEMGLNMNITLTENGDITYGDDYINEFVTIASNNGTFTYSNYIVTLAYADGSNTVTLVYDLTNFNARTLNCTDYGYTFEAAEVTKPIVNRAPYELVGTEWTINDFELGNDLNIKFLEDNTITLKALDLTVDETVDTYTVSSSEKGFYSLSFGEYGTTISGDLSITITVDSITIFGQLYDEEGTAVYTGDYSRVTNA